MQRSICTRLIAVVVVLFAQTALAAVPSSLNVQGRLTDSAGNPLPAGMKDFTFSIYNDSSFGSEIWPGGGGEVQTITTTTDGLWTAYVGAIMPLTDSVFSDTTRWLEVTVDDGINPITTLPRVRLVTGPFAFRVGTVDGARGGYITTPVAIGEGHTIGAASLVAGAFNAATSGAGTSAIVGGSGNTMDGFASAIIAGSGNSVTNNHALVAGEDNKAEWSSITGGSGNLVSGERAFIGSGQNNTASGNLGAIGGGANNVLSGVGAHIGGGGQNTASGDYATIAGGGGATQFDSNYAAGARSSIGGGAGNLADGSAATIGGGIYHDATGDNSTIGGGNGNEAGGFNSTVAGGSSNRANGPRSTVGGGHQNLAGNESATVAGGNLNEVQADYGTIGGGTRNRISGESAVIVGGRNNRAHGDYSFIGGGGNFFIADSNQTTGKWAVVGGGARNYVTDSCSVIGGGTDNRAQGTFAVVPGGADNEAVGDYSFAFGRHAKANHDGAFVWGSNNTTDFASTGLGQFLIRAGGGVGINTNAPEAALHVMGSSAGSMSANTASVAVLERGGNSYLSILSPENNARGILFGDPNDAEKGGILFDGSVNDGMEFRVGGNLTKMTITQTGNVGIGTTSPDGPLHVMKGSAGTVAGNGNAAAVLENNDECWLHILSPQGTQRGILFGYPGNSLDGSIRYSPPGAEKGYHFRCGNNNIRLVLDSLGNLTADGCIVGSNIACPSDGRLKRDITPLPDALARVEALRGVQYYWKRDTVTDRDYPEGEQIGLIAQEVRNVVPQAVVEQPNGYLAVDYARLVPLLIEGMKQQQQQIDTLMRRVEQLTQ